MPTIPLSFVIALFAAVLATRAASRREPGLHGWLLPALLASCALQSVLIGLRWNYDVMSALLVMPIVAALLPPLTFVYLARLAGHTRPAASAALLLPLALVLTVSLVARGLLDATLALIYLGYAAAVGRLALAGPDAFIATPFGAAIPLRRAIALATAGLLVLAVVDAGIALDFELAGGRHAAAIVGAVNGLAVTTFVVAALYAAATRGTGESDPPGEAASARVVAAANVDDELESDQGIAASVDALLRSAGLYKDPGLNLLRLSRKVGLPTRRVSSAINRVHSRNVSQHINEIRVTEACRLLDETDAPVSSIMLDVGFQTKSNFNREFRRIAGTSPTQWRSRQR